MSQGDTVTVMTGYGMDDCISIPSRGLDFSLCLHVFRPDFFFFEYPVVERCGTCSTGARPTRGAQISTVNLTLL
jgi:hypothetical protein